MISNHLGMKSILETEKKSFWTVDWDPVSDPKITVAKIFLDFLTFSELKWSEKWIPFNWAWNLKLKPKTIVWSVNWDPVSAPKKTLANFFSIFLLFLKWKDEKKRFPINWAWNLSLKPKTSVWSVNWHPVSDPKKTVAKFFLDFFYFLWARIIQKMISNQMGKKFILRTENKFLEC